MVRRWHCGVVVVFAFVAGTLGPAGRADAAVSEWTKPVDGPVVAPFVAPTSVYGPGHRGVDFAAAPGTPVRAAGDGVVSFAGTVADTLHVVIAHTGDLRTSYSFLSRVDVRAGERVTRGRIVGLSGGAGPPDEAGRLHFGLRVGDRYVDPMPLFRPVDLTQVVHLAPTDEPSGDGPSSNVDRDALVEGLGLGGNVPAWALHDDATSPSSRVIGSLVHAGASLLERTLSATTALARRGISILDEFPSLAVSAWRRNPQSVLLAALAATSERLTAWWRSRQHCTAPTPALDRPRHTTHLVMGVAGIDSSSDGNGPALQLPYRQLGYSDSDVFSYSYAPGGAKYGRSDTWNDLFGSARGLGDQLRAIARAHPGRVVDLVAHSLGGLVVRVFLQDVYDPADPTLPPLGPVVVLSSPLDAAPAASAAREIATSSAGRAALDWLGSALELPPVGATSVGQLDENGAFARALTRGDPPSAVHVTSIGAVDDVVVPATNISMPGATTVVVNPEGANDHVGILTSPAAMRAVQLALDGRAPPCVSAWTGLRAALEPVLIAHGEHGLGHLGHAAGTLADLVETVARR